MNTVGTVLHNLKLHQKAWEHNYIPQWYLYQNNEGISKWDDLQPVSEAECPAHILELFTAYGMFNKSKPQKLAKTIIPDDQNETFDLYAANWSKSKDENVTCYLSPIPLLHLTLIRVGYRNGDVISIRDVD